MIVSSLRDFRKWLTLWDIPNLLIRGSDVSDFIKFMWFFSLGYNKDHCYAGSSKTMPDLIITIKTIIGNIKQDMLDNFYEFS